MRALTFLLAAGLLLTFTGPVLSSRETVTICHSPARGLITEQNITVSKEALPHHLAHGDYEGLCADRPEPSVCEEGESCVSDALEVCTIAGEVCMPPPTPPNTCEEAGQLASPPLNCTLAGEPPPPLPADAIYVSSVSGSNSVDCGILNDFNFEPCETITYGLMQAANTGRTLVLVANGVYIENVSLMENIDLVGGYSLDFYSRDAGGAATVILGTGLSSPTISANSITAPTRLDGFIVHGPSVITPGANSIAISIVDSNSNLIVQNNVVIAGVAAAGETGSSGLARAPGAGGQPGGDAQNVATSIAGGMGGAGAGAPGGSGGLSSPPVSGTQNGYGSDGLTSSAGLGGAGGFNLTYLSPDCSRASLGGDPNASPGTNAGTQDNGSGGSGGRAVDGGVAGSTWISASGETGEDGPAGSGGGGGGAGGGVAGSDDCPNELTGPSGGGGGAGGAGGVGGHGGQGGGGAFAVYVINGSPTIRDNRIFLGTAGNGGAGGHGGPGGNGGQGGAAGDCPAIIFCGAAGAGGNGGNGGHGGGGGGGAGGPSVGIFTNFVAMYETLNTIDTSSGLAGIGGKGGQSLGTNGQDGEPGVVTDVLY